MLNRLFRNLMAPKLIPIGVDLGSEWLRFAQVQLDESGAKLIASAERRIPEGARGDVKTRIEFLLDASRQVLRGDFQGRQVVLGLSPSVLHAQHLRLPKMDEQELRKAVPWEARGKLPIEPQKAMLRYVVAGDAYRDREPGQEIVVLASHKEMVQHYLKAAERAKIDVVGMEPDPLTLSWCLAPQAAKPEGDLVVLIIDIGASGSRAMINHGSHLKFVRFINIGAEALSKPEMPAADDARSSGETATAVAQRTALAALVDELELCRRYYEATFPNLPIERIVFVGGGASQRNWCQYIARSLNIAAVVGDPLQRLTRTPGVERVGDLDLRQAAPAWTAAIGLSLRCQEDKNKAKA